MKIDIVNNAGEKISSLDLNKAIWGTTPHRQAQFDTLLSYNAQQRQGTHKVKNRAEVSGGGRKPWKQKGTGNARQGSIRAPQWKGGGVVFGPTPERNYTLKVNKKIRNLALKSALAAKLNSKNVIVINELVLEKPSTKAMLEMLTKLDLVANKTLVIIDHENQTNVIKSVNNLERTHAISAKSINIYDLLNAKKILITASAIKTIEEALK